MALYQAAGLRIGQGTRIAGPLILDLSLRYNTFSTIAVGRDTYINFNCRISAYKSAVRIGDECLIGPNVSFETAGHSTDPYARRAKLPLTRAAIAIGNNVWIGANSLILPGVVIGDNAIVAAGAVVTKSVAEGSTVGGVPARVLRE